MKLGYLVSQYPAVNHTFVLREVLALRELGFDISVVSIRQCDRPAESLSTDEAAESRRVYSVLGAGALQIFATNLRVLLRRPWGYLRGLGYAWKLTRGTPRLLLAYSAYFAEAVVAGDYFERNGVLSVHTHFSSTVALIMARVYPIKYSLTVHGPGEFADGVGFHLSEKVAGATFVATISHYGSSQVMIACDPKYWRKIHTLRLGVDTVAFPPRAPRSRSSSDAFKLVFVGRLAPVKAQQILIEALAILRDRGRNAALTLVGEGPSRAALEALVQERHLSANVELVGACNHDRIADFYRDCDAFALASFAEGVPVVMMEAMAMEVPCIATWITGIPELVDAGVDGLLVPPADPTALADAVEQLMDNPDLAASLGAAGRVKVLSKYHLTKNTQELAKVFRGYLPAAPG